MKNFGSTSDSKSVVTKEWVEQLALSSDTTNAVKLSLGSWSTAITAATLKSSIGFSGKADKVSGATSGHFAGLDANGNLTDSGHAHSDYVTALGTSGNNLTWTKNGTANSITVPYATSAGTATKLGSTNVGSSTSPIYLNNGTPTAISSFPEAYLSWGGMNFSGSYGPIDAAMVSELGACRTMFLKAAGIVIEYSRDAGETWVDYGASDTRKVALFSSGDSFVIGNATSETASVNNRLRVTTVYPAAGLYTELNKFVIYITTSGSNYCWCTIRGRIKQDVEDGIDSWTTFADKVSISGNSGYNVINTSKIRTYSNDKSTQYGELQFIFGCDRLSDGHIGLQIRKIFGFGGFGWSIPSNMAKTGHLYSFDTSQNAFFPAGVYPESNGSELGLSTKRWKVYGTSGNFNSTLSVTGNTTLGGTLTVGTSSANRATTLNGTLGVSGATTLSSTLGVTGNTSLGGTLSVTGTATLSSTLSVANAITLSGSTADARRIYFGDTSHYLELDSNGFHFVGAGLYANSWVASGGIGSGGGGGGVVSSVLGYSSLGGSFSDSDLSTVFNAYTVNKINSDLTASISSLWDSLSNLTTGNTYFTKVKIRTATDDPSIEFNGHYDNTLGRDVHLGTLSGYLATVNNVAYNGLKSQDDLFIENGKHLYTFSYGGAVRSIAHYPTANYDELRIGDSGGKTNILGSNVYINGANALTSSNVPNYAKRRMYKEFSTSDIPNSSSTSDTWWRIASVPVAIEGIDLKITNNYSNNENATVWFNISQGYFHGGMGIGGSNYSITQIGGRNKFVVGIRLVYAQSRGSSGGTAYIELLLRSASQNILYVEASTMRGNYVTFLTPSEGSVPSGYYAETCYTSKGLTSTAGFDCTWLFGLSANTAIPQTATDLFNMSDFLHAIEQCSTGLYVTVDVRGGGYSAITMNSVEYNIRANVNVGFRSSSSIILYYIYSGNGGSIESHWIEIGYSSGWKVLGNYTKSL